MVNSSPSRLDRTFSALSDPTRRALLARLEQAESLTVSELAQPFQMSLPAILKHLGVLEGAGLIAREKTGRSVACRLQSGPMEEAMAWLERYRRFWEERLDRLAAFVEGPALDEEERGAWQDEGAPASRPKDKRQRRSMAQRRSSAGRGKRPKGGPA